MNDGRSAQQVKVHFRQLVVEGVDGFDRARFSGVVEEELGRLLARDAISTPRSVTLARVDGGTLQRTAPPAVGGDAAAVGRQVARAIHGTLAAGGRGGAR